MRDAAHLHAMALGLWHGRCRWTRRAGAGCILRQRCDRARELMRNPISRTPSQIMPLLTTPILPPGSLGGHPQPSITAFDLVLRPWEAADRPVLIAAYSDPEIQRYHVRSVDDAEATDWLVTWARAWEQETAAGWAVTDGSQVLGRVALRWMNLHEGVAEVGYWVLPRSRGQRVASRP